MRKTTKIMMGVVAMLVIGAFTFSGVFDTEVVMTAGSLAGVLPIWMIIKGDVEVFNVLTDAQLKELSTEDLQSYILAKNENHIDTLVVKMEKAKEEDKAEMISEINKLKIENMAELQKQMVFISDEIKAIKTKGMDLSNESVQDTIKSAWDNAVKDLDVNNYERGTNISFDVAKDVTYGDITGGDYLSPTRRSITDLPKRQPVFLGLFGNISINSDLYPYLEQTTVTRDAQNVANCAAPTSKNGKETLTRATIEPKKIMAIIPFCLDYIADYPFMAQRIRRLLDDSLMLKIDQQIYAGTGLGLETNSILSVSSEFSAANVIFPVALKVPVPTVTDLVGAMATQISMLGELNTFDADTVAMNKGDYFLLTATKDANGRSLASEVITFVNGMPYIAGLKVVVSPLVTVNTLVVFDSTKGDIVNRRGVTVSISDQNNDLWEKDHAEIKGSARLNFLVEANHADSFMKCSDVSTAITAITKL